MWRRLKQLGTAQLADGLVALPADARTREQLEWVAAEVRAAAGNAAVWLARPTSPGQERELANAMSAARAQEYRQVLAQAQRATAAPSPTERARSARRLREELRRIRRRDFFPPVDRDAAVAAVQALTAEPLTQEPVTQEPLAEAPLTTASRGDGHHDAHPAGSPGSIAGTRP